MGTQLAFEDGYIVRPSGAKVKARFAAQAPRENTAAYKARKAEEHAAYVDRQVVTKKKKLTAADQMPLDLSDPFSFGGDEYTRQSCEIDLRNWHEGFDREVPDAAYLHFQISIPAIRDAAY